MLGVLRKEVGEALGKVCKMDEVTIINQVNDEDWYDLYNINLYEGAAIPDILSREITTSRLSYKLLGDVSEIRSDLVRSSYRQVGKTPYYLGGKATSTNIYADRFYTTVKADYMRAMKLHRMGIELLVSDAVATE